MTRSDERLQVFVADFFETWLFQDLSPKLKSTIASKLQLCSFQPGEVIYPAMELPSAVHFIVQGKVRILGSAANYHPTLAVVHPGTVIGWDSLLRRSGAGEVRAAMDAQALDRTVLTLALPADEFEVLALKHLMPALMQRISLLELFDTLYCSLSHLLNPASDLDLPAVVRYIEQEQFAVVKHCNIEMVDRLPEDRIWLVSSGEFLNVSIGTVARTQNVKRAL